MAEQEQAPLERQCVEFRCPECSETLWVFLPADGGLVTVLRRRDIPPEAEEDDSGAHPEPDGE